MAFKSTVVGTRHSDLEIIEHRMERDKNSSKTRRVYICLCHICGETCRKQKKSLLWKEAPRCCPKCAVSQRKTETRVNHLACKTPVTNHPLLGVRQGKLTAIEVFTGKFGRISCRCRCDCGEIVLRQGQAFAKGKAKKCDSCIRKDRESFKLKNQIEAGQKFKENLILEIRSDGIVCACECGERVIVSETRVKHGTPVRCRNCVREVRSRKGREAWARDPNRKVISNSNFTVEPKIAPEEYIRKFIQKNDWHWMFSRDPETPIVDLVGMKFGQQYDKKVIRYVGFRQDEDVFECSCHCGNTYYASPTSIKNGTSCGRCGLKKSA